MSKSMRGTKSKAQLDETYYLPDEITTFEAKLKEDWYIPTADYYIQLALSLTSPEKVREDLDLAQGIIPETIYHSVNEQMNKIDEGEESGYNTFNIPDDYMYEDLISPIKNRYVGEFMVKGNNFNVTVEDPDAVMKISNEVRREIYKMLVSATVAYINGQEQQGQQVNPDQIKEFIEQRKKEYLAKKAEQGKNLVDYMLKLRRYNEKLWQLAYNMFATYKPTVYFKLEENCVDFEVVPPTEVFRVRSDNNLFSEDDEVFVRKHFISISKIQSDYVNKGLITKKDYEYLKSIVGKSDGVEHSSAGILLSRDIVHDRFTNSAIFHKGHKYVENMRKNIGETSIFSPRHNEVEHNHLVFKTGVKIKILTYIDEFGIVQEKEVDNSYKLDEENGDISVENTVKYEYWEMDRFSDRYFGIYTKPRPLIVQRDELGKGGCKMNYLSMSSILNDFGDTTIPRRIAPVIALYQLVTIKWQQELAAFQGFINVIPESLLASSDDYETDERLSQLMRDKLLLINDADVDVNSLQALRSIGNGAQAEYLMNLLNLRVMLKNDARELADMNPERFGNIDTKGGRGLTNDAAQRVSMGSVPMHTMFDMFLERFYNALMDYTRLLYTNGVNISRNFQGEQVDIKMNYEELLSSDWGIFATLSQIERMRMEAVRESVVQAAAQNAEYEIMAETLTSDNTQELKRYLKDIQEIIRSREQMNQDAERQLQKYIEDSKAREAQMDREHDVQIENIKGEFDLEREYIKAGIAMATLESAGKEGGEIMDTAKEFMERDKDWFERRMKEREADRKDRELIEKKETRKSNEKIARMNKN
jgi:hypothetical protein